jgi:hypothetical protein
MTIVRQRLLKHIPGDILSRIGHPLLGNEPITSILDNRRRCFPWGPCRGIISGYRREYGGVQKSTTEYSREQERE